MKPTFILLAFILFASFANAQVRPTISKKLPPSRGHYQKLSSYDVSPKAGAESIDALRFELVIPEKTSTTEKTVVSGPAASTTKAPESKCDPEGCQPVVIGNGRKRSPHYLTGKEELTVLQPPANSSEQTRQELNYLLQLQQTRTEEDVRASLFYAGVYYRTSITEDDKDYKIMRRNLFHIGRSIGTWFNADSLPLTAKLVANVWKDAEYNIWKYKNHFLRIRPYKLETKLNNLEETNWAAYPSGHASNSYVNAFLFSELIPEFSDAFFKDAYDMAHSREIIGVHYPSDSESGRVLAQQLVKTLFSKEEFRKDFESAKKEIAQVRSTKGF